jgi:hypothetical protein
MFHTRAECDLVVSICGDDVISGGGHSSDTEQISQNIFDIF